MTREKYKEFDFKDFGNLDLSEDADYLVDSMDELYDLEGIQGIKERAIQNLKVAPGDKVLELGCGLGHDAETFGELVGPTGSVIAIDSSQKMLARAQRKSQHKNVSYVHANASSLNYPDKSFDICHADRVLISQPDPWHVLQEAIRLLKPHGKLSVTDCDFGSIVIHPFDEKITPILKDRLQAITLHPLIGRELYQKFHDHGLINIAVTPEPYIVQSFNKLNTMIDVPRILKDLCVLEKVTQAEMEKQLALFNEAEKNKMFLYAIIFFTVQGEKVG
ncbi:MAG TPA: methyltransferase domain-containing protein [Gammaproteobacteria bacterium]|nr:methyltransferase domain-containing protein [Gammaproteobacteria bacterium]